MKKAILLLSNNATTLQYDAENLNKNEEYVIITTHTTEEAIEKFQQTNIDVVVIYEDIDPVDKNKLSRIVRFQNDEAHVLQLTKDTQLVNALAELAKVIDNANKPSYTINDDALKNAAYNIKVEQAN